MSNCQKRFCRLSTATRYTPWVFSVGITSLECTSTTRSHLSFSHFCRQKCTISDEILDAERVLFRLKKSSLNWGMETRSAFSFAFLCAAFLEALII